MINKKYFHLVFVAIMAMSMTLVLSFVTILTSDGFSAQFLFDWLKAAGLGFCVAFPVALAVAPVARWGAEKLTASD